MKLDEKFKARGVYLVNLGLLYQCLESAKFWRTHGDRKVSIISFNVCVDHYRAAIAARKTITRLTTAESQNNRNTAP